MFLYLTECMILYMPICLDMLWNMVYGCFHGCVGCVCLSFISKWFMGNK